MTDTMAAAPVPLLLTPDLSASAKLIWLLLTLTGDSGDVSSLSDHSGLCRKTVLKVLDELATKGWYRNGAVNCEPEAAAIGLPAEIATDRNVSVQGRLLYGGLQLLPSFMERRGNFTYAQLSSLTGAAVPTLKRAVTALLRTGWLEVTQENRRAPICFLLRNPITGQGELEVARARERLGNKKPFGERLMREWLSLLVDSGDFQDNASPGFLVNPLTKERLQFDRFYPPKVAFEFNGPQHYRKTELFAEETVAQQRARDLMKRGMCGEKEIALVVVHAQDLRLKTMQRKVGNLLPLRDLTGHELLIEFLEEESRRCRRADKYHGKLGLPKKAGT